MTYPPAYDINMPLDGASPELSYPGVSPQLLARVTQLWSAGGMDFETNWRLAVRSLPGFRALPRLNLSTNSADVDLVFLFDQCVLWMRALHEACSIGRQQEVEGLSTAQWHGLAGVTARLLEQLAALRLLALTDLPMPAMQIARSISEDVDMTLILLIRPKLAQRFAECTCVEDANEFWRRHIAGGRAFHSIAKKLYTVGIDHSADTEYAKWRKSVLTTLGAAVHSNALSTRMPERPQNEVLLNGDSLHFATFRMHELCAFAQLVEPDFTNALRAASQAKALSATSLAALAAPLNEVLVNQIQSLSRSPAETRPKTKHH